MTGIHKGDTAMALLRECSAVLKSAGIPDSEKEAELMLRELAGVDRVAIYRDDPVISEAQAHKIRQSAKRRSLREPLAYILGHADFFGLRLAVGPGVLIPRPETELLVQEAINAGRLLPNGGSIEVLDLCAGSGAVAIAVALNLPSAKVTGTEISEKALFYAEENRRGAENVCFLKGDLFGPVEGMKFDIITANPPYVKKADIEGLEPEIRNWEPREALDGSEDGLRYYREIFHCARAFLNPGGVIIVEVGFGQKDKVSAIATEAGFSLKSPVKDYAGIERVLVLK